MRTERRGKQSAAGWALRGAAGGEAESGGPSDETSGDFSFVSQSDEFSYFSTTEHYK